MNKKIEDARQAALNVLKLSKRTLEQGLELHNDAFVMESYGFTPRCHVPEKVYDDCIELPEFINEFEEYNNIGYMRDPELREECRQAWKAAGVNAVIANSGFESNVVETMLKRLSFQICATDMYPELYQKITRTAQLSAACKEQRTGVVLTTNAIPVSDPVNIEQTEFLLRVFHNLGVRMMHFTYNRANFFGSGCGEINDGGITDFGRRIIRAMNKSKIIIDVSHSGMRTSLEAAELSEMPIMASHTVMGGLSDHYRAKNDEVCRQIVKKNGLIGICCYPLFLQNSGDINAFLKHIDYAVEHFGADHVAIGSDRHYNCGIAPVKSIMPKQRAKHENLWSKSASDFVVTPAMTASLEWTNFPLFTCGMLQHGHSEKDIRKILGENVVRVLKSHE